MVADIIQANYQEIEQLANRLGQSAESNLSMSLRLRSSVEQLTDGGWVGDAAAAFYAEMDADIFPAVQRLTDALAQARTVTLQIKELIEAAEEEAASRFQNGDLSENSNGDLSSSNNALRSSTSHDPVASAPQVKAKVPPANPNAVFNEAYMENFIDSHNAGEESPRLNQLMEDLLQTTRSGETDRTNINPLLDQIADIRGIDRSEFRSQYDSYMALHDNATSKGDIDLSRHGDYMGSTASLRYGKVVGDVYGIDPVFGALLNPTGGLVGPDSQSYEPGDNDAVGYHGIFHDAGGYLYNHQDKTGPGYDYLNREPFDTTSPATGQLGGISWWAGRPQLDVDLSNVGALLPESVPGFVRDAVGPGLNAIAPVIREGMYIYEGGSEILEGVDDIGDGNFAEGAGNIFDGGKRIVTGTARSAYEILTDIF